MRLIPMLCLCPCTSIQIGEFDMKAVTLKAPGGLDKLCVTDGPGPPPPRGGEIPVRLRASSLNYHDYVVAIGQLKTADNRIPMSDGAGEGVAVGEGVGEF